VSVACQGVFGERRRGRNYCKRIVVEEFDSLGDWNRDKGEYV
jgi:hypothetical protein